MPSFPSSLWVPWGQGYSLFSDILIPDQVNTWWWSLTPDCLFHIHHSCNATLKSTYPFTRTGFTHILKSSSHGFKETSIHCKECSLLWHLWSCCEPKVRLTVFAEHGQGPAPCSLLPVSHWFQSSQLCSVVCMILLKREKTEAQKGNITYLKCQVVAESRSNPGVAVSTAKGREVCQ